MLLHVFEMLFFFTPIAFETIELKWLLNLVESFDWFMNQKSKFAMQENNYLLKNDI